MEHDSYSMNTPTPQLSTHSKYIQLKMDIPCTRTGGGRNDQLLKKSYTSSMKNEILDAGELKIENDKLQTQLKLLNQKLKSQGDSEQQIIQLRKKLRDHEEDHHKDKREVLNLKNEVLQL